jgi:MSHA pilin protein MshD
VEIVATIVILAIALVGLTFAVRSGINRSSNTLVELRAVALAQAYLDEIVSKRFDERTPNNGIPPCRASAPPPRQCSATLGPDGGEGRATYDDVDDYNGLLEGDSPGNPLRDAEGNPRDGYPGFQVEVAVRYIEIGVGEDEENLSIDNELDDQYDGKVITVTVTYPTNSEGMHFSAYKSNF